MKAQARTGGGEELRLLFGRDKISKVVGRLASLIGRDYRGRAPVFIGVLKGSFIFLSDLVRALDMPVEIDFIRAESYGGGTVSPGAVRITKDLELPVRGRDVVVVEDIVDTGLTLGAVVEHIRGKRPASLKVCALLDKPSRRRAVVRIDYRGMEVGDFFVVGYGLDCAEKHRNLPGIYEIDDSPGG